MIFEKNGNLRDSKKPLVTESGRTIFNASPEDWIAEGWIEYIPSSEEEESAEKGTKKLNFLEAVQECENYFRSRMMTFTYRSNRLPWISLEKRQAFLTYIGTLEEDAILFYEGFELTAKEAVKILVDLNKYEHECTGVYSRHLKYMQAHKADLEGYDFTKGYPEMPSF